MVRFVGRLTMAPAKKPPDDTQEKVDALFFLAREFAADDCPLQAIKCYEAVCNKSLLSVLPLPEARARVQLAYLLLKYTDNVHRAKTHLETTVSVVSDAERVRCVPCVLRLRTFPGVPSTR